MYFSLQRAAAWRQNAAVSTCRTRAHWPNYLQLAEEHETRSNWPIRRGKGRTEENYMTKPLKNDHFNGHFLCVVLAKVHIRARNALVAGIRRCSGKCNHCMSENRRTFSSQTLKKNDLGLCCISRKLLQQWRLTWFWSNPKVSTEPPPQRWGDTGLIMSVCDDTPRLAITGCR